MQLTIPAFLAKWTDPENGRFRPNDTFEIDEQDFTEFAQDVADSFGDQGGTRLNELTLPQAVVQGRWYVVPSGIWEARSSFNASASPMPGANWRAVVSFLEPDAPLITAASINDATAAGRAMLKAASAAAQRVLLDKLGITANQYGPSHPAFDTADGPAGAWKWVIQSILALNQSAAAAVPQPAAPTNGEVNDVAKELTFKVNPAYPNYSQYKENGRPGTTAPAYLSAATAYQVGNVVHVTGLAGAAKGSLAYYVAGSGNVPDGKVLSNSEAFSGAATSQQPTTSALTAGLAIAVASIMAGQPLSYTVTASGGTGPYIYAVVATNSATGATVQIGSASGSWTPPTPGDYQLTNTVTDSTGASKISAVRTLHVSSAPLANAGSDTVLTQPASSVTLQGSGYEQGGTIAGYSWSQSPGDPASATFSSKTIAQPTVSGLTALGAYHFNLIVTDAAGNVSLADEVVVSVQAAGDNGSTTTSYTEPGYAVAGYFS